MSEDYRRSNRCTKRVEQLVLRDIFTHVTDMGRDIRNYGLPELDDSGIT
jgi:ATP-dependent DNA helicase PIF1